MDMGGLRGQVWRMDGWTDIRAGGWVARLPEAWRPYALLGRFDRPIGAWLLVLRASGPSRWRRGLAEGLWLTLLFLLGAFAMRAAGCVVNDLWDRDLDRQVERTRGGRWRPGP
jgi:4-hydroxybenzoate polyprenyltransferase